MAASSSQTPLTPARRLSSPSTGGSSAKRGKRTETLRETLSAGLQLQKDQVFEKMEKEPKMITVAWTAVCQAEEELRSLELAQGEESSIKFTSIKTDHTKAIKMSFAMAASNLTAAEVETLAKRTPTWLNKFCVWLSQVREDLTWPVEMHVEEIAVKVLVGRSD